jgi:predicted nucleotidyltransferase
MSGSAGGNRIPRSAVEKTVKEYIDKVLSKVPGFKSAKVSGSYNTSDKQDFGDIDLIASFEGEDKKIFKKELAKYLESLPDDVIVPFKSEKYAGKKTMNTGEIVTILYPISGMPGEFVQIDNIIALSEEEGDFKQNFLDYPAEIQGLILGLVKVVTLEEDPNKVIARMGIKNIPALEPNQEYEFNLSSAGLTLRIVTLGEDYKQLERTDAWKSSNWGDVKKLLADYNIDQSFKDLVSDLKKLKNPRSKNRIKGIFKSMVSIKSGEVNTPKGDNKQMALDTVATLEGKYNGLVQSLISGIINEEITKESIALYPGKFKPPHKGHFEVARQLLNKVDRVEILISGKEHEGIDAKQSKAIWELYNKLLGGRLDIKIINESPVTYTLDTIAGNFKIGDLQKAKEISDDTWVKDMINIIKSSGKNGISQKDLILKLGPIKDLTLKIKEFLENGIIEKTNNNNHYIAVYGKGDEERYRNIGKDPRYMNAEVFDGGAISLGDENISATNLRKAMVDKDIQAIKSMLPDGINAKEYIQTLMGQKKLQEAVTDTEVICDNCGWRWSIKDGGDDLYVCHKCGHDNTPKSKETWNLQKGIVSLTKYMLDNKVNISPLPKLKFINNDGKNANELLGKTAYYDPLEKSITLYTLNRHPKDILRSYSHEMVHHIQNLENRLNNISTTNTNEDGALPEIEKEAYEKGNMMLRNWEDNIKNSTNEYVLDTPKFNQPKTFTDKLNESLNEITLNPSNSVETYGNLNNGKFQIDDMTYIYDIKQVKNPYDDGGRFYNIMFHPKDNVTSSPTSDTTKENYIKILNTMYKIILDFAEEAEPEYIGISSLDNDGSKNYHKIYANLTDNKYNRIPGYFRKDVNLNFDTPQGKGRFVVLKQKNK